ncbi:hypothetical protein BHE74_00059436, partial [Ensete ventricosum]
SSIHLFASDLPLTSTRTLRLSTRTRRIPFSLSSDYRRRHSEATYPSTRSLGRGVAQVFISLISMRQGVDRPVN